MIEICKSMTGNKSKLDHTEQIHSDFMMLHCNTEKKAFTHGHLQWLFFFSEDLPDDS